jgi:hypothetical protein
VIARLSNACTGMNDALAALDAANPAAHDTDDVVFMTGDLSHLSDAVDAIESLVNVFKRARACQQEGGE